MLGATLVALKMIEYSYFSFRLSLDIYLGIIAIAFLGIGIYAGLKFRKKAIPPSDTVEAKIDEEIIKELGLSKREMEVLQQIAEGHSNQEIADRLFVSLNTIKTHINNIYTKLDVKRRTQAVSKAKSLKIIQ